MTPEQIKALISEKIAGQGNQVDIGGALPEILAGIVGLIPEGGEDGPIVVTGSITEADTGLYNFTPADGQPSLDDVKAAFLSGRVVVLSIADDDLGEMALTVTEWLNEESALYARENALSASIRWMY